MQVEFWFEFASTYSYPAAMRVERLAREAGVTLSWRPFLLGPIFGAQGWNDSPFNIYPAKGANMWRDLERICDAEGLTLTRPPVSFPQNGLHAARIALVGAGESWGLNSCALFIARILPSRRTFPILPCWPRSSPRRDSMPRTS